MKEQHQDTLTGWGLRIGLFFTSSGRVNRGADEDYRTELKLSHFKGAGQEKVDGRTAEVIRFTVTRGTVPTQHTLWLDTTSGLPLKMVVRTREGFGVTETFRDWRLDPQLPAEAFALPKDLPPEEAKSGPR